MKTLIKILCAVLVLSSAAIFAGCGENNDLVASTVAVEETTDDSKMNISEQADISKLHAINYEGDEFAGYWQITEGEGSQFKSFVYAFDGKGKAYLIIGTTGYIENYKAETKTDDSGSSYKAVTVQLMFGINGVYKYEFSEDKSTLTLTNTSGGKTTTLKKMATFSFVPIPEPEPVVDEKLLGAWKDDNGEYYYFDKSGIMYNTMNGINFTFAKYSAKDGKVTSVFTTNKEETNTVDYSVDGDTLTYNKFKFKKIAVDELV